LRRSFDTPDARASHPPRDGLERLGKDRPAALRIATCLGESDRTNFGCS
jgi:hypothetical protein